MGGEMEDAAGILESLRCGNGILSDVFLDVVQRMALERVYCTSANAIREHCTMLVRMEGSLFWLPVRPRYRHM